MEPIKGQGQYLFSKDENFEDYSSGRVLYGATGASNFPVRLASEIFQRAVYYLKNTQDSYTVYDPFCGVAYTLTVLGFLHGNKINTIIASDSDSNMLEVANKNLSLLTQKGLNERIAELKDLENKFNKQSHTEALHSANRLGKLLLPKGISSKSFSYNVLSNQTPLVDLKGVDLVIADLPYGKLNKWQGEEEGINSFQKFLNNIIKFLNPNVLVCISANKKQEIKHEGFEKIKSFKLGTRKILFLKPLVKKSR